MRAEPIEIKFERHYVPEPNTGCFLWHGAVHRQGYGQMGVERRTVLAHRVAWQIKHGTIPDGMCVLHKCDVPACVNVDHLFLGTYADNMADCGRKGRSNKRGEINGNARLTENDVRIIRATKRSKYVRRELAARFGVSVSTVADLRHSRRNWWWV